jgi:hypothetical protein
METTPPTAEIVVSGHLFHRLRRARSFGAAAFVSMLLKTATLRGGSPTVDKNCRSDRVGAPPRGVSV